MHIHAPGQAVAAAGEIAKLLEDSEEVRQLHPDHFGLVWTTLGPDGIKGICSYSIAYQLP